MLMNKKVAFFPTVHVNRSSFVGKKKRLIKRETEVDKSSVANKILTIENNVLKKRIEDLEKKIRDFEFDRSFKAKPVPKLSQDLPYKPTKASLARSQSIKSMLDKRM